MPTAVIISTLKLKKEQQITNTSEASEVVDQVLDDHEVLLNNSAELVTK